jgi:nucleotide-binding universal stress UspA family protein
MQTIVVAYNEESSVSTAVLERAAAIARAFSAALVVTSVSPVLRGPRGGGGPDPVDAPQDVAEELGDAQRFLEGHGSTAEYVLGIGDPADAIVTLARERGADLIVVGGEHVNVLQRLVGQGVTDAVAHHAPCDVLIVHGG